MTGRVFRPFTCRQTALRVCSPRFEAICAAVVERRRELEDYIIRFPNFAGALAPLPVAVDAPEVVRRMAAAAALCAVGPMAAVAGCLAEMGAEAALAAGCDEALVENGGDIFLASQRPVTVALYCGPATLGAELALRLRPADLPLAVCSSSGRMGHSLSLGRADLATVIARDAALADAAATRLGNLIRDAEDLAQALERVGRIPGIRALIAVAGGRIALWGDLPELLRNREPGIRDKASRVW